jgi:general stress protein YciG
LSDAVAPDANFKTRIIMPQTEHEDIQAHENSGSGRQDEAARKSSDTNPGIRKSSGQGAVRSREDGRLHDNLSPEQRSEIGRRGGQAVSRNREHMAQIGRKGGLAVSSNREHMAQIGQKGGRS